MDAAQPPVAEPPPAAGAAAPVHRTAARSVLDPPVAAGVLLLAFFLGSFAATNSDLWAHLAAGRLVAGGRLPTAADPFAADDGATWVNHAWLFDTLLYLLYQAGGG